MTSDERAHIERLLAIHRASLRKLEVPDNPDREISFADFIDKALNRISQLRNNAAHTEPLSRHLYDELHDVVFQGKRLGLGALNTLLIAWPL